MRTQSNVFLDVLMVGVLKWGAPGAAVATVLSQGICIVIAAIWCKRRSSLFELISSHKGISKSSAVRLVKMGLPISMQDFLVMISFLVITAMAQNIGAGLNERAKKCLWLGVGFSLIFGVASFLYLELAPQHIMGLFTSDANVIQGGVYYLRGFSIDCVLVCFVFCMGGLFNGHGETAYTMKNNLVATFAVRIPVVILLSLIPWKTMFLIGLAAPSASLFSVIWFIISYRRKVQADLKCIKQ